MFYHLMLLVLYGFRCSSNSVYLSYLYGFCYLTNSVNFPRLYGFCYATNSGNAFELQHFFICNCSFSSLAHVLRQLTNIFLGCI